MLPVTTVTEQPHVLSKMRACVCMCVCVCVCVCVLSRFSRVQLFVTLLTVALYPWDFPGKNPGGRLPFPPPGTEPRSLASLALAGRFFITSATWEAPRHLNKCNQSQNLLIIILLFTPFLSFFISIDFSNSQLLAHSPLPSFIYKRWMNHNIQN